MEVLFVGLGSFVVGIIVTWACLTVKYNKKIMTLSEDFAKKTQDLNIELSSLKSGVGTREDFLKTVNEEFSKIALKAFNENQEILSKQNKTSLEEERKLIFEGVEKFRTRLEEINAENGKNTVNIKNEIANMLKATETMNVQADKLTKALKYDTKAVGNFGESVLELLLDNSGLINKRDFPETGNYITQKGFKDTLNPANHALIPDAVVYLSDNRNIVIDSKCSLIRFQDFVNTEDEQEKQIALVDFKNSLKGMVKSVSEKYNNLEGLNTPDFKLLFVPIEACMPFIYSDGALIEDAMKQNVIFVGPSTLLATLKVIKYGWVIQTRQDRIEALVDRATKTYDSCVTYTKNIINLGKNFENLYESFNKFNSSVNGSKSFIKNIERLKDLGLKTNAEIDKRFLESDEQEEVEA